MRWPVVIGTLILACTSAIRAQSPVKNPFIGSWKLNLERSKIQGAPPRNYVSMRQYTDSGDGWMFHKSISSYDGGGDFTFPAARYDGKEYPVYTSATLGAFLTAGTKPARTVSFKLVDAHTLEYTDRQEGEIVAAGASVVSDDGKSLTETNRNFDREGKERSSVVAVYDRQ
jgi:hypothetical protein